MANQEHFDFLKKGVQAWNQWRKKHPNIRPNLVRANLSGAVLSSVDLSEADLSEANLSGADLSEALQLHFKADQ
jgi:uncharacterized protein YjbI with pentapeptide repeats